MLPCPDFYTLLTERNVRYFTGVPDSLLKDFCSYVTDHTPRQRHVIAANEGAAVALAAGHYLATGEPGLVYMQNSGQGNAVNPLMSLVDPDVYAIPLLMLVGWRGEPGKPDEPQHVKQGKVTLDLFDAQGIGYEILPETLPEAQAAVDRALLEMRERRVARALVVRKGTFSKYALQGSPHPEVADPHPSPLPKGEGTYEMTREQAIAQVAAALGPRDIIVSTTGMPSRELFEYRVHNEQPTGRDFLTVGAMGHASQIALAIAEARPERDVYCLDGDGAALMHMGGLAVIGQRRPGNFRHVILNNGAHDSVGGQPTAGFSADFPGIARCCGYGWAERATTAEELDAKLQAFCAQPGPALLEIRVARGSRKDLGRPTTSPVQNREAFMEFVAS